MILITPGDPDGIGPEVVRDSLDQLHDAVILGVADQFSALPRVERIEAGAGVRVLDVPGQVEVEAIRLAATSLLAGVGRALVTGPINKEKLVGAGFGFTGHTDFLGHLCGVERPVMAFVGGRLRVALVTVHVPLRRVHEVLTTDLVVHTLTTARAALQHQLGIDDPKLLVCGLNPHAGDGGVLGHEDAEVIAPAVARVPGCVGPISAEAAFRRHAGGEGDMVVAMYHDQGLVPLKVVDFGRSVNWTLGLPIVRTSVDHGTAYDIAGTGTADASSMRAAIALADRLTRR